MASLMHLVLKSLPFAALDATLRAGDDGAPSPALPEAAGADLSGHLEFLPIGSSRSYDPPHHTRPTKFFGLKDDFDANAAFEIWSYEASAKLDEVRNVTCRLWSENYDRFQVLDALRFGYEPPPTGGLSSIEPFVRATDTKRTKIDLPLTKEFIKQQWLVSNVTLPGWTADPLWKLETPVDKALVRVFVYEFTNGSTDPKPLEGEDSEKDSFAKVDAACQAMASAQIPDGVVQDLFADTTFFPDDLGIGQSAETGGKAAAVPKRNRIVVILTWTFDKATCDFAPGGAIPMGRVYPHAIIVANAAYGSFELSIQFDRPKATKNYDNEATGCSCSGMRKEMTSVLVTEANHAEGFTSAPYPVWSNLFSYYCVAPEANGLKGARMRMVRNDRPYDRPSPGATGPVTRRWGDSSLSHLYKLRRQGEYDNIHMAPPMQAPEVKYLKGPMDVFLTPIDEAPEVKKSLEKIWMAPFCAHDCFHLHWRWADTYAGGASGAIVGGPQFFGWGEDGPFTVGGVAMVPLNQSVDLWYRDASCFTYHAFMGDHTHNPDYADATMAPALVPLQPGEVQVVCHHGAAYGLNAEYWKGFFVTSQVGFANEIGLVEFFGQSGRLDPVSSLGTWSVFYWRLRYDAYWDTTANKFVLYERTDYSPPNDIFKAQDL